MSRRNYEDTDVHVRPIVRVILILVVSGVAIHVLVWGMFDYYRARNAAADVRRSQIIVAPEVPPSPRLEVSPTDNFEAYKQVQQEILNSYGWVSRAERRVRIPIERAMELESQ